MFKHRSIDFVHGWSELKRSERTLVWVFQEVGGTTNQIHLLSQTTTTREKRNQEKEIVLK